MKTKKKTHSPIRSLRNAILLVQDVKKNLRHDYEGEKKVTT